MEGVDAAWKHPVPEFCDSFVPILINEMTKLIELSNWVLAQEAKPHSCSRNTRDFAPETKSHSGLHAREVYDP